MARAVFVHGDGALIWPRDTHTVQLSTGVKLSILKNNISVNSSEKKNIKLNIKRANRELNSRVRVMEQPAEGANPLICYLKYFVSAELKAKAHLSLTTSSMRVSAAAFRALWALSTLKPAQFCPLIWRTWSPKRSPARAAGELACTSWTNTP